MIRKISSLLIPTLATWLNAQEQPVAFVDVTVVPMDKEQILPHQTVVVVGGRITQVASAASVKVPHGAMRINGMGKFLMPGLADMHVHFIRPGFGHCTFPFWPAVFFAIIAKPLRPWTSSPCPRSPLASSTVSSSSATIAGVSYISILRNMRPAAPQHSRKPPRL